jgi:hypothetical protein
MRRLIIVGVLAAVAGCGQMATEPTIEYADDALVTIKYKAYYSAPYLTPAASDMAARHCAEYGKSAYYKGANVPSQWSTVELHEFRCE